ncbi:MAG: acetoacetate--CoA ligase, partial [Azospira oryzae]
MEQPLWTPSPQRIAEANLTAFLRHVRDQWDVKARDYSSLYRWSIEKPEQFWVSVWDFCGVIAETRGERVLVEGDKMPGARFFPEARLNFAENCLRRRDETPAIVFWSEERLTRQLTHSALYAQVSRLAQALCAAGVKPGDRVVGFMPNLPETVIAMLAAASLGAVWSSCSPDFGVQGVLDRFGQIEPKVLFTADGYFYGGRTYDSLARVAEFVQRLPTVERVVVVPYLSECPDAGRVPKAIHLAEFIAPYSPQDIRFARLPFNHPLYILYSSGTTGVPKCIVHGAGGTLLQHLKEHRLHTDLQPGDRLFYFTTCGWMMWNWLASALASEATLMLYDGSPFHPAPTHLFDYIDAEGITVIGTSAKYIDSLKK